MAFRKLIKTPLFTCAATLASAYSVQQFVRHKQNEDANGKIDLCNRCTSDCAVWNSNWDYLAPQSVVKPLENECVVKPTAIRHIVLVRHGEYYRTSDRRDQHLTERGRLQAQLVGRRLHEMKIKWANVISSTLLRAQETKDVILKEIEFDPQDVECSSILREGAPIKPIPLASTKKDIEYFRDQPRIEAAFRQFFYRAPPTQTKDSYTLIIGHANVMRYFVCRALQLPPEAWLRMDINHASITWLTIYPNGHVTIKYLGDTGFMPAECLTNHAIRCKKPAEQPPTSTPQNIT